MRVRTLLVAAVVVAAAAACVRLGVWQLARLEVKRAMNARLDAALARPPFRLASARIDGRAVAGRVVALSGRFDERRHVLLAGLSHEGEPGVHVVTPFIADGDSVAVLVDRGWLPAPDGVTARPQDHPAGGARAVAGLADTLGRAGALGEVRAIETDSVTVLSAERLDRDSLAARLPYPLAGFTLAALPSKDAPPLPLREPPRRQDEMMHLSYAVQWFTFAVIILAGPAALAWSRRRRAAGAR